MYNASLHEYLVTMNNNNNNNSNNNNTTTTRVLPRRSDVWPAAFMVYSDLKTLAGLATPTDYGSGVEYANGLAELTTSVPVATTTTTTKIDRTTHKYINKAGLQIGLWLSGSDGCRSIVNGTCTHQVNRFVDYLAGAPFYRIFVRLGYEFDNPSFGYMPDPIIYRRAFRMVVASCRQHPSCYTKVQWVWHSWAAGVQGKDTTLDDFYPGDMYVDWIGVSIFQQVYHRNTNTQSHGQDSIWSGGSYETLRDVLDYAAARDKPVLIAESTPFGGIDERLTDAWGQWFQPVLDLIDEYHHLIAMWSYIDCNWNAQPMWNGVGFGDARIVKNATILQLWRSAVLTRTVGYGSLETYCGEKDDYITMNVPQSTPTTAAFVSIATTTHWSMQLGMLSGFSFVMMIVLFAVLSWGMRTYRRRRQTYSTI